MEEEDGGALARRKLLDRVAERERRLAIDQRPLRQVGGIREGIEHAVIDERAPAAKRVDRPVVADAVQPRSDPRVGRPARGVLPEPDQGVLHGILGFLQVAEEPSCEAQQAWGFSLDQPLEGGRVAPRDGADFSELDRRRVFMLRQATPCAR